MEFPEFNDLYEREDLKDKREIFPPLEIMEEEDYDPSIAVFYNFSNEPITEEYIRRVVQSSGNIKKYFLVAPAQDKQKSSAFTLDKKAQNFIQEYSKKDKNEKMAHRF
jgi:hypothetical protein